MGVPIFTIAELLQVERGNRCKEIPVWKVFPKKISFAFFHSLYGDTKLFDNLVKKKGE